MTYLASENKHLVTAHSLERVEDRPAELAGTSSDSNDGHDVIVEKDLGRSREYGISREGMGCGPIDY